MGLATSPNSVVSKVGESTMKVSTVFVVLKQNIYARVLLYIVLAFLFGVAFLYSKSLIQTYKANPAPEKYGFLIIDLQSEGLKLTVHDPKVTKTFFDMDADGFAEQTAWIEAGNGFLAIDKNNNQKTRD